VETARGRSLDQLHVETECGGRCSDALAAGRLEVGGRDGV
jgi:hypothetical protein